jgi:hypothetical protein
MFLASSEAKIWLNLHLILPPIEKNYNLKNAELLSIL